VTEDLTKPRYESPILIDLGDMAKGKGSYCAPGPLDTGTYCTAGGSNPLACTAGTAAFNACTEGTAAQLACTGGNAEV
jgi:hypothetical protein